MDLYPYGQVFISDVICSVDSREKVIALTFDDGPDEQVTPQVLDVLRKHKVQAVFFCVGSKIFEKSRID